MKLKLGYCGICEVVKIWYKDNNGRIIFTDDYAEVCLALSDGTITRNGVCGNCANSLTDQKVADLLEKVKGTWEEERGFLNDHAKNLKVTVYDTSKERLVDKQIEFQKKSHEEALRLAKEKTKYATK